LPIGLSHLGVSKSYHSRDRDTRWAFCYSRGCGCGDVKMADVSGRVTTLPSNLGARAMRQNGKTLVEILIVIAIVALLAALVVGVVFQARLYAKRANCASNLRQIHVVLKSYVEDYEAPPPPFVRRRHGSQEVTYHWQILSLYQPNLKPLLVCPADPTQGTRTRGDNQPLPYVSSYNLHYTLNLPLAHPDPKVVEFDKWFRTIDPQNPEEALVTCEWHSSDIRKSWALFADGHIGWARARSCTVDGRTAYYWRPIELTEEQCRMLLAMP
jgi:prepilin-type N-terminal cleavage/methylation domain-containing protein